MSTRPAPQSDTDDRGERPFRWTALWIGAVLIAILSVSILIGALIHNLNQTRMVAIFAIGVVSFLGMLELRHQGPRFRGFEPGEVRAALATSFTMVFFAAIGIFLFSTNSVGDFGRNLMDHLTSLFGVVIGFYFASSAAIEYVKVKEGSKSQPAASESPPAAAKPAPSGATSVANPNGQAALEAEVAALRAAVEALTQKVNQPTA